MTRLILPGAATPPGVALLDPAARGYLAQVHPVEDCTGQGAIGAGAPSLSKIWIPQTIVATNILVAVCTAIAGSPLNCFATLFKSDGTIIGSTADRNVAWATLGVDVGAIAGGTKTITGGAGVFIWGSILVGTGTTVQFGRKTATLTLLPNAGLTAATYYSSINAGGLAGLSTPTAFTPASNSNGNSGAFWMAIS